MEALDQFKQKGYVLKLKTNITPDLLHYHDEDFVALLYMKGVHMGGMCFVCSDVLVHINNLWYRMYFVALELGGKK